MNLKAIQPMNMIKLPLNCPTAHRATANRFPVIRSHHDLLLNDTRPPPLKGSNPATRLAQSLTQMLQLQIESIQMQKSMTQSNLSSILEDKSEIPVSSPRENISQKWHEIQGSNDWDTLLDPLHPWLRRELIKYGEFAQATYDAFDFDPYSEYCGSCRFNLNKLFEKLGLIGHGYNVTKYIYAMSNIDLPSWLEKSQLGGGASWSKDSNWMGFVAVSNDEESKRIGRRDIVVAWRGTVSVTEWYEDFQKDLERFGHGDAKVEQGFLSIYTSKCSSTRYNKSSASEQVIRELTRLIQFYRKRGEDVSLTITGHSLGGALALLNAYEAASLFPDVSVSVFSFGAPRVGNSAFRDELNEMGVKTLRVVIKQDVVPWMPGMVFNERMQSFDEFTGGSYSWEWVYTHVGVELKLDARASPYLKRGLQFMGNHMLETYLHLLDGFESSQRPFRADARRDIALVNKECDMLINELKIPPRWYQEANKGLVQNAYGRWVKPKRDPEDIPSPIAEAVPVNC